MQPPVGTWRISRAYAANAPRHSHLPLSTVLKVAHNRLERLDEGFLAPNLRTTIECLWVSNNNMQELPALFNGVEKLTDIHIDYNPMRSPPVELLSEGMNVIIQVVCE